MVCSPPPPNHRALAVPIFSCGCRHEGAGAWEGVGGWGLVWLIHGFHHPILQILSIHCMWCGSVFRGFPTNPGRGLRVAGGLGLRGRGGGPSQGSPVDFALVVLVECWWASPQAQMLLMSSIAPTLSNNNRHSSLLPSFSEACYGRDTE